MKHPWRGAQPRGVIVTQALVVMWVTTLGGTWRDRQVPRGKGPARSGSFFRAPAGRPEFDTIGEQQAGGHAIANAEPIGDVADRPAPDLIPVVELLRVVLDILGNAGEAPTVQPVVASPGKGGR